MPLMPMAATFSRSDGATLVLAKDCHGMTEEIPNAAAAFEELLIKDLLVCFIILIIKINLNQFKEKILPSIKKES